MLDQKLIVMAECLSSSNCSAFEHEKILLQNMDYFKTQAKRILTRYTYDADTKKFSLMLSFVAANDEQYKQFNEGFDTTMLCYNRIIKQTDETGSEVVMSNDIYYDTNGIKTYFSYGFHTAERILSNKFECALKCYGDNGLGALMICKHIGTDEVVQTSDFQYYGFEYLCKMFEDYKELFGTYRDMMARQLRDSICLMCVLTIGITEDNRIVLHAAGIDRNNEVVIRAKKVMWITDAARVTLLTRQLILPTRK
jgi:hypothetical protein